MSEQPDKENLVKVVNNITDGSEVLPTFYRGELIRFTCEGSLAKFSYGLIVLWGFPREATHYDSIICNTIIVFELLEKYLT